MTRDSGHHHHGTRGWRRHAEATLRSAGYRSGGARTAVIDRLADRGCLATAQEVHDALRADGQSVGLASVYRVLDQLVGLGAVTRVELGDGVSRFEPALPDGSHHHHMVCLDCGDVRPFESGELERAIHHAAERERFDVTGHEVVLQGTCPECAARTATANPPAGR